MRAWVGLHTLIVAGGGFGIGVAQAETPLRTVPIVGGLARPVFVTAPPEDNSRLFIVEQRSGATGRIRIYDRVSGTLLTTPFLSINPVSTGSEQGLLGLAFHPDFASNGHFFVNFTDAAGATMIRRYTVSADPNVADAASAYPILSIPQPFSNHNGGWLGFGPDGYLYIATGDGGSANDPGNRAQDITSQLLGKMLRIDVDRDDFPADATRNYGIPPTNPFVGATGDDEIWAYGLRNPWRCSFDRLTGDLWIADVGQGAWEEVDFQPAGAAGGRNYGWRCMEGLACTGLSGCTCDAPALTLPIHVYSHSEGCSITGGYVYRGRRICDLAGTYFFADYCSARIWTFRLLGGAVTDFRNRTAELDPDGPGPLSIASIVSFGEDAEGELYICSLDGGVYQVVPNGPDKGDLNNDGQINFDDIDPFVLALSDPVAYQQMYGFPPEIAGDANCDGVVNFDDIDPFVALLAG